MFFSRVLGKYRNKLNTLCNYTVHTVMFKMKMLIIKNSDSIIMGNKLFSTLHLQTFSTGVISVKMLVYASVYFPITRSPQTALMISCYSFVQVMIAFFYYQIGGHLGCFSGLLQYIFKICEDQILKSLQIPILQVLPS